MKRPTERGVSVNSHDATDKMLACLNHSVRSGPEYQQERNYFDACARWWGELTPEQRETGSVAINAFTHHHRKGAEGIVAVLPAAPKCPL
jgi:hypothetical protein